MPKYKFKYNEREYDEIVQLLGKMSVNDIKKVTKIPLHKIKKIKQLYIRRNYDRIYEMNAFEPHRIYPQIKQFMDTEIFT